MKRIICTVTNDLNHDQRMHKICGSLAKAGYEVLLVGRLRKTSKPLVERNFKQKRMRCFFEKGKLFYIEYNLRLLFFLLFTKADILCAIDLDTIMPNLVAGKLRGKKLVYDAHEYFTEVPEVVNRPAVKRIWQWVEKVSVPRMDTCYTVSASLADLFERQYHKHFELIRNVPVLNGQAEVFSEPGDFILYQGALNVGRGLEELILAMKELPLKLLIAGEGDLSDQLRKLVKDNQLQDKVEFLGWVSPEQLKILTPKAFLGYNLLENLGKSYYYSLANKFFDYMHAGVPGICNHFPEYEKINSEYKIAILTNLSTKEIVSCVKRVLTEKEVYQQMKANCLKARGNFCWQLEEMKLVGIYNAL
jgi:glycosyltransferase involved in cell wall biosynthesis